MVQWGTIQRRLVERREAAGLTGRDAATRAGVSNSYVSNLENGYSTPGAVELVAALARVYCTSVDYLLGLTDNPAPAGGLPLPEYGEDVLRIMAALPPARCEELRDVARLMADAEHKRAQLAGGYAQLEQAIGAESASTLWALFVEAMRSGDGSALDRAIAAIIEAREQPVNER